MNANTTPARGDLKSALGSFGYWLFAILFFETLLHGYVFGSFDLRYLFAVGFTVPVAAVLSLLTGFLPKKAAFVTDVLLNILLIFAYGSQLVYYFVFGSLYSLSMVSMGGDAVTSFWRETLLTMLENLLPLALLFLPLILLILLKKRAPRMLLPTGIGGKLVQLVITVAVQAGVFGCLFIGGTGYFTNHYFYHSLETTTDQAAERFGLITAMRLELTMDEDGAADSSYYTEDVQPTTTPEAEKPVEYNVLDIGFDHLNTLTDNQKLQAINNYCASLTGTEKNDYTGMLSDYNLIVICGESFDTGALDPVLTPTLYRMSTEGLIFNNYYNSYPNVTTNGEYALMQGLYPDLTRGKDTASFLYSRNNYIPFALGNVFMDQRGVQSYGYHNFDRTYYGRDRTHPNLGYQMKFARSGMTFTTSWPSSDLEMMEQSVDDYIGTEQFHAYYMTFSGHYKYDKSINPMAQRNWDAVKDLDYSEPVKAYLSCNIELEKAMAYLMERLEEAGVADKTAIVLAGDHFPYGLTDAQYSELVGYELDHFNKYKSSLLFWVGGLEENIVVDAYCCNVDILPTVLNLWGFDYDSRMLPGTDALSDGEHVAVLTDKSFFTDKVWFNTNNGEIRYLVDESTLPEGYIDSMIQTIKTKFSISTDILNTNYWDFVFSPTEG